jgi:sugar (pentulose or hexulose) kinase
VSVLAVDIGSSRTKALLGDWDGRRFEVRSRATPHRSDEAGEWSYPPDEVANVVEGLVAATARAHPDLPIDTLVFSCLGTAMAPVADDGRPLGPALAPADARPLAGAIRFEQPGLGSDELARRTGSDPAVPSFLLHARWWTAAHPDVVERAHRFRSLRGFVASRLGEVDAEDHSWASRTMLYDLDAADWSEEIIAAAGVPAELLPPLMPSTAVFTVDEAAVERLGLAPGARLVLGAMDNGCSLLGAAGPDRSGLVDIVGTFEHMAGAAPLGAARQVAERAGAVVHAYLLEGQYIALTRLALGDLLARVAEGAGTELAALLDELSPEPTGRSVEPTLEAVDEALRAGRSRAEVLQGVLESSAAPLRAFADAWAGLGRRDDPVAAVGGGAGHAAALQLKASLLGRSLVTLASGEGAALGALRLAAMAVKGATLADACRLFANPIVRTIGPSATARTVRPEGVSAG